MDSLDEIISKYTPKGKKRKNSTKTLLVEFIILLFVFTAIAIAITIPQMNAKKDQSMYNKAMTLNDYSFCHYIGSQDLRTRCYILIITKSADQKKNTAYCSLINQYVKGNVGRAYTEKCVDGILFDNAVTSVDSHYCTQIHNTILKQTCYDNVNQKINQLISLKNRCNYVDNLQKKEICLTNAFQKLKDYDISPEFCNRFKYNEKVICEQVFKYRAVGQ